MFSLVKLEVLLFMLLLFILFYFFCLLLFLIYVLLILFFFLLCLVLPIFFKALCNFIKKIAQSFTLWFQNVLCIPHCEFKDVARKAARTFLFIAMHPWLTSKCLSTYCISEISDLWWISCEKSWFYKTTKFLKRGLGDKAKPKLWSYFNMEDLGQWTYMCIHPTIGDPTRVSYEPRWWFILRRGA